MVRYVDMKHVIILILIAVATIFGYTKTPPNDPSLYTEWDSKKKYQVIAAVDGDTIRIATVAGEEKVRLLGIDTPEVDPTRGGPECYGPEASKQTKKLVEGQYVTLEIDSSQGERDTYGRRLAYVRLDNGTLLNEILLKEGYAYEYTFNNPYLYQKEFKTAERSAQQNNLGVWQACTN